MITICAFIVAVSIAHTFVNIIPATLLGAPDEDAALSVLPAHKLLVEGRGYEAITLSALGSFGAILVCISLMLPFKYLLGEPFGLYTLIKNNVFWILLGVIILIVATEGKKGFRSALNAFLVILISGIFGTIVLDMPVESPFSLPATSLFPALAGLFGMSTQVYSLLSEPTLKRQNLEEPEIPNKKSTLSSIVTGSFAGAFVSIIPGITSATGTIIALTTRGKVDERQAIITLSAVNTACAFLVIIALFVLLKARSGAAIVISNLIDVEEWSLSLPPLQLLHLLIPILLVGSLAFPLTCLIGKRMAGCIDTIPYKMLIKFTMVLLSILVFVFVGIIGILILFVATAIGLIPIFLGVRRSNCMGVLMLPLMIYFL
jgi:putative membrane protein